MGMARFWVQATAFSEMNRMSPACILSLAYWRTTSSILSALVIRCVFTGMRWYSTPSTVRTSCLPGFALYTVSSLIGIVSSQAARPPLYIMKSIRLWLPL